MPSWPGPVLAIGGLILAVIGLGLAIGGMIARGEEVFEASGPVLALSLGGVALLTAGLLYSAVRQLRVRRHLPPERYRGPSVLLLMALVIVIATVPTLPFGADAAALVLGEGEVSLPGAVAILVSTQLAMLLVAWLFVFRPRALVALPPLVGSEPWRAVRAGIGWGVLAWVGASLLSLAVVTLLERLGIQPGPETAEQAVALLEPWLVVLAVVILAPLAEEVFFRGVAFNAWLRERGRRWAFIGSSLLFAAIHFSLVALLPILLLGLALAWVYARTGSLLAPIAMHATVNGISVTLALLVRFEFIRLPA